MNWKSLLFSFEGRVGRGTYWGLVVVSILLFGGMAALSIMSAVSGSDPATAGGGASIALLIVALVFLWPALAIQAKRWHDVDKSAWWILIGLVPAVGAIVALVFNGFLPAVRARIASALRPIDRCIDGPASMPVRVLRESKQEQEPETRRTRRTRR